MEDNELEDSIELDETNTRTVNEELVRWMTEGTSPYMSPRSDCG